jgi:hypothetical protein
MTRIPILRKQFNKVNFNDPVFISKIYKILKKNKLSEFDSELINQKIKDVNFDDIQMGEFTFFNVFFNSQNI